MFWCTANAKWQFVEAVPAKWGEKSCKWMGMLCQGNLPKTTISIYLTKDCGAA